MGDTDSFLAQVENLCCAYTTTPPARLLPECRAALNIYDVLQARRAGGDNGDIAVARGWLTLLSACLLQDSGQFAAAAAVAHVAEGIGQEVEHPPIVGWAREIDAWQANTNGHYRAAVQIAGDTADDLGDCDVVVQLRFQQAMGLARLGDFHGARTALTAAEHTLDAIPAPDRPDNHFVLDRPKLVFYATKVYDLLRHDRGVSEYAAETLLYCQDDEGNTRWPMRVSEVQLALAHMQARLGNVDAAAGYGMQALSHERICAPTLLGRARELDRALARSGSRVVRDFEAMLRATIREHAVAAG